MSHFEYLMVMVSIILGLGATQALRGLSKLARSHRPFLPVALWGATLFYLNIQIWWGYWDMADVASWTQPTYYIIVLLPCALFAAIELLMPIGAGAETDWEKHYFSIRPWFFGVLITFQTVATLASYIINDVPLTHPYRIIQAGVIAVAVVGLFTSRPRAHIWISGAYMTIMLAGQVLYRMGPKLAS